jgi:hypothetical protein
MLFVPKSWSVSMRLMAGRRGGITRVISLPRVSN